MGIPLFLLLTFYHFSCFSKDTVEAFYRLHLKRPTLAAILKKYTGNYMYSVHAKKTLNDSINIQVYNIVHGYIIYTSLLVNLFSLRISRETSKFTRKKTVCQGSSD